MTENPTNPRFIQAGKLLYTLILCAATLFFVYKTLHWRWMWDESIMHYGNFLMDHGMVLYRDVIDMNMPGAYFIDGWAIRVFGNGDLGARAYEFFLLATLTGSMIVIAWPCDWFAGVFAGVLFTLIHASEGPTNSTQREEIMTVLIMAAFAFLFSALRRRTPLLMLPFGFLAALATSLKPTAAPLGLVMLAMAMVELRRRRTPAAAYFGFALAGLLAAVLVVLTFFLRTHSFGPFVQIMRHLLPYYAGLQQTPFRQMVHTLTSSALLLLLALGLVLALAHRDWGNWERWAIVFGVLFGAFSYFVQHKGYPYHRYPFLAFFLLWAALEFAWAAHRTGWVRVLGLAGFSFGVLYMAPVSASRLNRIQSTTELPDTLERDLIRLGATAPDHPLQHQVQCLDMVLGCVTALYHLDLVQNTGFLGDFLLFQSRGYPPATVYRNLFWDDLHAHPPQVLVITNSWFAEPLSFDKLNQWPDFVDFLQTHYTLRVTRNFNADTEIVRPIAYRLYVLQGSPAAAVTF